MNTKKWNYYDTFVAICLVLMSVSFVWTMLMFNFAGDRPFSAGDAGRIMGIVLIYAGANFFADQSLEHDNQHPATAEKEK